jgi:hypothetical protein
MEKELSYPILARPGAMLGIFAACLALLHIFLVKLRPLQPRTWKKVDYVWLGVAAVGIIGAAGEARRLIAATYAEIAKVGASADYDLVRRKLEHIASPVVCRGMTAALQAEYDQSCAFGRASLARLPADPPNDSALAFLRERPPVTDGMLKAIFGELDLMLSRYSAARDRHTRLVGDSEYSFTDEALLSLAPFLFCFALALRITKVTGELRAKPEGG